MNIRRISTAIIAIAALTVLVPSAGSATAQNAPVPDTAPSVPATAAEPVQLSYGVQDVLKLSRAKVGDEVTIAFIRNSSSRFTMTAAEIVYLREQGVSDRVLASMLNQQSAPAAAPQPPPQPAVPATAPSASAPQYIAGYTPPTSVYQTEPASTVYAAPYYYASYPYYYGYGYSYPAISLGFVYGNGWGYGCYGGHYYGGNYCGKPYYHGGYYGNGCGNGSYSTSGHTGGAWYPAGRQSGQYQATSTATRPSGNPGVTTYRGGGNSGGRNVGGSSFASVSRPSYSSGAVSRSGGFASASRGGMSSGGFSRGGGGRGR